MKNKNNINQLLALATCSLLGETVTHTAQAEEVDDWKVQSAFLYYAEGDDRVTAVETVTNITKEIGEEETLSVTITTDVLTGASPNGATPTNVPQTFTSPSGNSGFSTAAGEIPLDEAFKDTRYALDGSWSKRLNEKFSSTLGFSASQEFDYDSFGINAMISIDTNQKNTTWQLGVSYADDEISPVGGVPIPLVFIFPPSPNKALGGGGFEPQKNIEKNTLDFNFGVTQILSKNTLVQFTYAYSDVDGYQTDPYKIVSVVDGTSGSTVFYLNESRPEKRQKHSVYAGLKHFTKHENIFNPSVRYFTDDWGIDSFTVDLKYRFNLNSQHYIEPHIRYYDQSAAYFYAHSLVDVDGLEYVTADYRLAQFDAITIGAKYAYKLKNNSTFETRLEYYTQNGNDHPDNAIGVQQGLDLFSEVDAIVLQFNYSITW